MSSHAYCVVVEMNKIMHRQKYKHTHIHIHMARTALHKNSVSCKLRRFNFMVMIFFSLVCSFIWFLLHRQSTVWFATLKIKAKTRKNGKIKTKSSKKEPHKFQAIAIYGLFFYSCCARMTSQFDRTTLWLTWVGSGIDNVPENDRKTDEEVCAVCVSVLVIDVPSLGMFGGH